MLYSSEGVGDARSEGWECASDAVVSISLVLGNVVSEARRWAGE